MPAAVMFNQFVEDLGKAEHNFTDDTTCTLTLAMMAAAPDVSADAVLADITTISHANLSSRVITGVTWEQTAGVAAFAGSDLTLTASGTVPTFRYIVLYNDDTTTPTDALIMYWDLGQNIDLTTGQTYVFNIVSGLGTLRQA
jgi:hypothetical protein